MTQEIKPDHPLARAHRLYMSLSTGALVLHRRGDHREVDMDQAVCRDIAEQLANVMRGETWTCFQCGEIFTDRQSAEDHFGTDPAYRPGCVQMLEEGQKAILEDRRMWRTEALKERDRCEQLEYSASSEAAMLLSLFGTMDLRQVQREYERMRDSLRASNALFAKLIKYDMDAAHIVFQKHDPQLVTPEEYLSTLEK